MDLSQLRRTGARMLLQARDGAGFSQEHMAQELGVSTQTVRNWESGRSEPGFASFLGWLKICHVDLVRAALDLAEPQIYHGIDSGSDLSCIRAAMIDYINNHASASFLRAAAFITLQRQRDPVMTLFVAYLRLPLHHAQRNARCIRDDYILAERRGELVPGLDPDMALLDRAAEAGRGAALAGKNTYTMEEDAHGKA